MRAVRRHHVVRLKKNRKNYYDTEKSDRQLGMVVTTPKRCSSPFCCGNPRRTKGREMLTVQEKKANIDDID